MSWKDWSYWLKGGIIALLIPIILVILFFFDIEKPLYIVPYLDFIGLISCGGILDYPSRCSGGDFSNAIYFLTIPLSWIMIGMFVGWIYGKIKSKLQILESSETTRQT